MKAVIKSAWHIPVPNVQWKTPDDGQRNCPKHVEFLDKKNLEKLVRLLVLLKGNLTQTVTLGHVLVKIHSVQFNNEVRSAVLKP